MWNPFATRVCAACLGKDALIAAHEQSLLILKSQLAHSREREEKAVDALLAKQGVDSVTPRPKLSSVDSEAAMRSVMGMFLDEDDKGDGKVRDIDKLDYDHK